MYACACCHFHFHFYFHYHHVHGFDDNNPILICIHQVVSHLFSLLADLSKNSSVTQMDPYNIAICFAPNLCPIPEGYDQMQFTNQVNEI